MKCISHHFSEHVQELQSMPRSCRRAEGKSLLSAAAECLFHATVNSETRTSVVFSVDERDQSLQY